MPCGASEGVVVPGTDGTDRTDRTYGTQRLAHRAGAQAVRVVVADLFSCLLSGGTFPSAALGTSLEENRFPQPPSKDLWVGGTA